MNSKFERGALNLVWVAVFSGLLASVAMATLFSLRNERNLFAEGWVKLTHVFQQTQRATGSAFNANATASVVYKCTVNGLVVYSNVACDVKNPTSKKVDLQDTSGFEAPKIPVAVASEENGPTSMQDKMIEKAMQRH